MGNLVDMVEVNLIRNEAYHKQQFVHFVSTRFTEFQRIVEKSFISRVKGSYYISPKKSNNSGPNFFNCFRNSWTEGGHTKIFNLYHCLNFF